VQAPYTIAQRTTTHVEVRYQGQTAATADFSVAPAAPAIFPALVNQDGSLNSAANPADQGSILTLFATGEGVTDGANVAGQMAAAPYARPQMPVAVTVGAGVAALLYAGAAPGLVGMLQVDAQLPGGLTPGAVTLQLSVGTVAAPAVTVWMR
jgi:uncharacterized protein (TIGR03437 family)